MSAMLDYMQLCRLCLVKEKVDVPIFGDDNDVRQIFLKITACLPVKVSQEDNLPKKICDSCLYKVDLLYQFWNTTVNAEKQLIQWLTEIGVEVNIKNSETQSLPILPQSHAHPHSMPETILLKQEGPDMVDQQQPPSYPLQGQQNMYSGYDNLEYPQPVVTMKVDNSFVPPLTKVEPPAQEQTPTPKKRGRPAGATNKKSPPKKKAAPAPAPTISPRSNTSRRSSATAAAAAVAAAAAAASDSEEDSDGDHLGGADDDFESDEDHLAKEEVDSDEDYVEPTTFVGVPSTSAQDGEQPGPSGLSGVNIKGAQGANSTESGLNETEDNDMKYFKFNLEAENFIQTTIGPDRRILKHYKCPNCPKTFQYKSKFLMHSVRHSKEKTCICPVCNKLLKSKFSLNSHLRFHEGNIYKCTVCLKEYSLKSSFDGHVNKYPPDIIFPCNKCERKFHLKVDLTVHQARDHKNSFTCFSCGKIFSTTSDLKNHVIVHNGSAPTRYQCEFCGRICSGRQTLNVHRKSLHLDLRSVVCEICGKKLTSKSSLNNHLLMHRGEKPLACEHCGKQFLSRNTLNIHRRTHTGERPHSCPYCEKRFTQRNSLIVHIRKHTGDKPFGCDMCEEKFVSRSCWKIHRKSKHQIL